MAVARVDAALPAGEGKAILTVRSQLLLLGTELNNYLVEKMSLGIGV